jgi:hypothetical protein
LALPKVDELNESEKFAGAAFGSGHILRLLRT